MEYRLKKNFRKNDLPYTLIKRTEKTAMYGVGGAYADKILGYEVFRITISKDKYGVREHFPSNEEFGSQFHSKYFGGAMMHLAEVYFDALVDLEAGGQVQQSSNDIMYQIMGKHGRVTVKMHDKKKLKLASLNI